MSETWTARGLLWRNGSFSEGWVTVEDGRIQSTGTGAPPSGRADATGIVLPSLVNAHTHVGDFMVRGEVPEGASLADLVAPPHGLKHRVLSAATPEALRASVRDACAEAFAAGTRVLIDFREGGAAGARALREAGARAGVTPVILGRSAAAGGVQADDLGAVLDASDGLGLSALRDVAPETARAYAKAARGAGKRFALHWSEAERESVDDALDLAPDFVVHAVHATADDFARLADARVPVVVCPRSNARLLERVPDVRAMLQAGVDVAIGSDNAMLQSVSVLDELRFAREHLPGVTPEELMDLAVDAPRRRLDLPGAAADPLAEGAPADLVVLARDGADPYASLFSGSTTVIGRAPPADADVLPER